MEFFQANIKLGEVLVQLIAFVLVFLFLRAKAWGPILQGLEERRRKIKSDLDHLEASKRDMEALKAQYTLHLQKIEDEARAKIQDAIEDGRRIAKEIQDKARTEAQATFDKAKENLELEAAKARISLRRDIADLALSAAERVIRERMSDDKNQQIKIMEIIEDLEKTS